MAVSIAGVFLASARPSELAYRHTRTQLIDFKRAELSTDGSWDRYKSPWRYDATHAIKCLAFVLPDWTWQRPNLIRDVRKDLGTPALPWTIGVSGMGGYRPYTDTQCTGALDVLTDTIIPAQFSVANASLHPDLAGTVSAAETRAFHREARFSPGDQCYHWNNNCESYWRVGVAMGESMLELTSRRED